MYTVSGLCLVKGKNKSMSISGMYCMGKKRLVELSGLCFSKEKMVS